MTRSLTAFVLLASLAACGDDPVPEQQADDERSARGEVLGGTISDDMIPLDQRRSQSPPLRSDESGDSDESGTADPSDASSEELPAAEAPTEPAEETDG